MQPVSNYASAFKLTPEAANSRPAGYFAYHAVKTIREACILALPAVSTGVFIQKNLLKIGPTNHVLQGISALSIGAAFYGMSVYVVNKADSFLNPCLRSVLRFCDSRQYLQEYVSPYIDQLCRKEEASLARLGDCARDNAYLFHNEPIDIEAVTGLYQQLTQNSASAEISRLVTYCITAAVQTWCLIQHQQIEREDITSAQLRDVVQALVVMEAHAKAENQKTQDALEQSLSSARLRKIDNPSETSDVTYNLSMLDAPIAGIYMLNTLVGVNLFRDKNGNFQARLYLPLHDMTVHLSIDDLKNALAQETFSAMNQIMLYTPPANGYYRMERIQDIH